MTVAAFFDAARTLKRELTGEGLTQAEVARFNDIINAWTPKETANPTALTDAGKFYQSVHASSGTLTQQQVDGLNTLLQAFGVAGWPISWAAYGLATAWHETAQKMQPVREAFWKDEAWRKANLRYFPHYGRGYVQLTWPKNYQLADSKLDLGGRLIAGPDLALNPEIAAKIMVCGMDEGWFCSRKLADYLPKVGKAGGGQFEQARRIINGTDKDKLIAGYAMQFQTALEAGGWR